MKVCPCPESHPHPSPLKNNCVKCGFVARTDAKVEVEPMTLHQVLDRYEQSHQGWGQPTYQTPAHVVQLRLRCEERELAGRSEFGDAYLHRNNISEAAEEVIDCCNYLAFDAIQAEANGQDPEWDLILEATEHLAKVYEILGHREARRMGAP